MLQPALRRDYVSPGFQTIRLDDHFPNMIEGEDHTCSWPHMRRNSPHRWYCDRRILGCGFLNRDEVHILFNTALQFTGADALEIGCFMGWSACHLAAGGVRLDVVDPMLGNPPVYKSVVDSPASAKVLDRITLHPAPSPHAIDALGRQGKRWSLMFIDGDHEFPGPVLDAVACERYAKDDALILFHDVNAPAVAEALLFLKDRGWNVILYHTAQIMAAAWQGAIAPVRHFADPQAAWPLPNHLRELAA